MEEVTGEDRWQIMTERTLEFREKDKGDKDKRVEGRRWRKETQKNGRGYRLFIHAFRDHVTQEKKV